MARMALLKDAARAVGLSEWELRMGARAGKYPHMRAGNPITGKLIFDLDILEAHIKQMIEGSIKQQDQGAIEYGKLRKVF